MSPTQGHSVSIILCTLIHHLFADPLHTLFEDSNACILYIVHTLVFLDTHYSVLVAIPKRVYLQNKDREGG